jgi:5-methylcytosine-specific restriction endonuclease McrA
MSFDLWGRKPVKKKRVPVKQSTKIKVITRSNSRCAKCGKSLANVTPQIHHKNGDPSDNRLSNLIALCPNCHSVARVHSKKQRKNDSDSDPFSFSNFKLF